MAKDSTDEIGANTWTQLTNANVTAATFQNRGGHDLILQLTVGANAPAAGTDNGVLFRPGEGFDADKSLSSIFPGVSGGNRIYALGRVGGRAYISHA